MQYRCTTTFAIMTKIYERDELIPNTEYNALPERYKQYFKPHNSNVFVIGDLNL